jgi:hypothetical protein
MKDPKNIEALNKLVTYYITLHGLQGISLERDNPFAAYFTEVAFMSNMFFVVPGSNSMDPPPMKEKLVVSTNAVHELIKGAYEFYQKIDNVDSLVHPMMKEQVIQQLGADKFNELLESSIDSYKNSFFFLLNNYNSYKEDYVKIKLSVLELKMNEFADLENYEGAAEMRDKITDLKTKI